MLDLNLENQLFKQGFPYVAGVDEAGRGPLAGPVVAACVIIDQNFKIDTEDLAMITDSKKLSAKKREKLFAIIKDKTLAVEIGVINNNIIDKINILQASFLAMRQAIDKIKIKPDYVLVDGNQIIPQLKIKQTAIIDGDAKIFVIAAASIIAKVARDWIMHTMNDKYPNYGFSQHKGYGTKMHLEKIKGLGPCPIHRLSFAPFSKKIEKKLIKKRLLRENAS